MELALLHTQAEKRSPSIGFAFPETCCEHLIIEGIISILCHRASLSMFKAPALRKVTWNYHILL
ncbi:hypothetical protein M404DRAFT_996666 [Pisolithus tinctorius Marx 270]|uniref:Uncharacterized protein n=1 Tax=Pisolithus tinctorius Marx 270 TaxID=870435 RepID=A0A0C3PN32_PISTI|nr:hypothetical protein M404DRAFT_996666 [Pisolithus tinctorius Marx 270]